MKSGSEERTLLTNWLATFANELSLTLFSSGDSIHRKQCLAQLSSIASMISGEPMIYVLRIKMEENIVPVYVGKTTSLLQRWESHFNGLESGKGRYSRWREVLLKDGKAKYDVNLSLIPASRILKPPIPDFPTTVGSVEYQLVGLISECYPETCLNVEGKPH